MDLTCKCSEIEVYDDDIEKLDGSISTSISNAAGHQATVNFYLNMAGSHLVKSLSFNSNEISVITNLGNAGSSLEKAESTAASDCAAESGRLGGIRNDLQTTDTAYHEAMAAAAEARRNQVPQNGQQTLTGSQPSSRITSVGSFSASTRKRG